MKGMLSQSTRVAGSFICALVLCVPVAMGSEKPTESEHRRGPNGYEGWTLNSALPEQPSERLPWMLVIARKGRVIRRIKGDPFVWNWIFWANGKQVAYESGPLHFGLSCMLADVKTGRVLESFDCFHGIPDNAPGWLRALENAQ